MKTAVVTGGTIRLGKIIADSLRSRGWRVFTVSHRADSGADVIADFASRAESIRAYAEILRLTGGEPPDAWVNNAALFHGDDSVLEAVNLAAPKTFTTLMASREEGVGAVVNILDARRRETRYGELKEELRHYTVVAAETFANTLRVNAVSPGPVLVSETVREKAGECPFGRPTADDVAAAVAYLLSAEKVTGVDIPVDGGSRFTS